MAGSNIKMFKIILVQVQKQSEVYVNQYKNRPEFELRSKQRALSMYFEYASQGYKPAISTWIY